MVDGASGIGPTGLHYAIRRGVTQAVVVQVGGGLRTFRVADHDIVDGYGVDSMVTSGRGQVLVPWPNRLDHGCYTWDGQIQQLPINEIERSNAIHGLVRFAAWTCHSSSDDRVEMAHTVWPSPGYPFTLDLTVAYQVSDAALVVSTTVRNVGTEPAPFGAGQHPYLLPPAGATVDQCELVVPAGRYLETDDRGLPIASHPVSGSPLDFTTARPIGAMVLDTAFTELEREGNGRAQVKLAAEDRSITIWMDEHYPYVQVFTGDTLPAPRRRTSVAIEPMTCPPNAFASKTNLKRLDPDETFTITWGLVVTGA